MRLRILVVLVAGALLPRLASAHDLWLEPERSIVPVGAPAKLSLFVGEDLKSDEEKVFERAKVTRLAIRSRNGTVDLFDLTKEQSKPAVSVNALGPGEFLVVCDRAPVKIELTPEKFDAYLREEGLDAIVKDRAMRGESQKPGRERYTRWLKSLVHVGHDTPQGMASVVVGQKLEIVLDPSPNGLVPRDKVTARILFEGKPLAGASVEAHARGATTTREQAKSGPDGRVTFTVGSGLFEIRLVHMRRCAEGGAPCKDADWESFWSSFTMRTGP